MSTLYLAAEFLVLFIGVPAAMLLRLIPRVPLAWLLVGSILCTVVLMRDPSFDQSALWNAPAAAAHIRTALFEFAAVAVLLTAIVAFWLPKDLFSLVKTSPRMWALFMFLYPILSVYPQELIYRAFLFHRYAPIFPTPMSRIVASTVVFAFGHIFFKTPWVATSLTFLGGLLFSARYSETQSLLLASILHALYGQLMFTVGLGRFFISRVSR